MGKFMANCRTRVFGLKIEFYYSGADCVLEQFSVSCKQQSSLQRAEIKRFLLAEQPANFSSLSFAEGLNISTSSLFFRSILCLKGKQLIRHNCIKWLDFHLASNIFNKRGQKVSVIRYDFIC